MRSPRSGQWLAQSRGASRRRRCNWPRRRRKLAILRTKQATLRPSRHARRRDYLGARAAGVAEPPTRKLLSAREYDAVYLVSLHLAGDPAVTNEEFNEEC